MATFHKPHWGFHWQHPSKPIERDPVAEALHRDRVTALIVLGIVVAIFAALIALAVFAEAPLGGEGMRPWMMPF